MRLRRRRYLKILELAAKEGEARVNEALRVLLDRGEPVGNHQHGSFWRNC